MCIFCGNEIEKEELAKRFKENCSNCNGRIIVSKKNGRKFVSKFPKNDKERKIFLIFPWALIFLTVFLMFLGNITLENIIRLFFIGFIILIAFNVFCCIKNIQNLKNKGYLYYGLINVLSKNEKRIRLFKVFNYFQLIFGIQFVIIMSLFLIFVGMF